MELFRIPPTREDDQETEKYDSPQTLVLAFGNKHQLGDVAGKLVSDFPSSVILGCSTAGHFQGTELIDEDPVILGARFERSALVSTTVPLETHEDSAAAGEKLAAELAVANLKAVLVLSDGLSCNGTALVDGLVANLPEGTVVFGGFAADGEAFVETTVLAGGVHQPGHVAAVGFVGEHLSVQSASRGGWHRFGPERTITHSENNILHELDGEAALHLYARYLGDRGTNLPAAALSFPLGIRAPKDSAENQVVRAVLQVDPEAQTMTFFGDMPTGWRAQLMRSGFDTLVEGAEDVAMQIAQQKPIVGDAFCLAVSCVGRRQVMGARTEDELDVVVETLGNDIPLIGFYSYGEVAPGRDGVSEFHNQTMTLTLVGEV